MLKSVWACGSENNERFHCPLLGVQGNSFHFGVLLTDPQWLFETSGMNSRKFPNCIINSGWIEIKHPSCNHLMSHPWDRLPAPRHCCKTTALYLVSELFCLYCLISCSTTRISSLVPGADIREWYQVDRTISGASRSISWRFSLSMIRCSMWETSLCCEQCHQSIHSTSNQECCGFFLHFEMRFSIS